MLKSIIPLRSSSQPAARNSSDIITSDNLPPSIMGGIADLFIAFDAGRKVADADGIRKLQICAEALAGFEISVAEYVLKRMRTFNPRNPFPPTAQDLYEECVRIRKLWCDRIIDTMIGGNKWGASSWIDSVGRASSSDPWGPPPFTTGCYAPEHMIIETLTDYINLNASDPDAELARLDRDAFERLPNYVFGPGRREAALAARALHAQRLESQRSREARKRWWDGLGLPMREAVTHEFELARAHGEKNVSDEEAEARARIRMRCSSS